MTLPSSQIQETFSELVDEPDKRFQKFFDFYCNVNLNPSFPISRYLRGGNEMIRMANVYYGEHDYFHAFVLYSRYLVLYLDKIKSHPQYSTCDKSELNPINKQLKTIAFPQAEKLKKYIKGVFESERIDHEKQLQEEKQKKTNNNNNSKDLPNRISSLSAEDFEILKNKYQIENENELRLLQEKELNSILDSIDENKNSILYEANNEKPASAAAKEVPLVDRSLKPKTVSSTNNNQTNNYNLRTILIPSDLMKKFSEVSLANTNRNVETCGILAGKLSQNVFVISHCIIPKQTGSSDTCSTEQEHELFDTIDQLNLITLGWIHTHPSQTAFLSSVDLHTQYGYQVMIPEAIAVVVAPSKNENRIFILEPTTGMKEIADCRLSGFHPHTTNPSLFEECDHVREDPKSRVSIIDLRMISSRK